MKKPINKEHIEGYVYDHDLSVRTVQSQTKPDGTPNPNYGKEFIAGKLDVQTDEEGINIVTINFTYVTATTSKGARNETFYSLKSIIDESKTVLKCGAENATMVTVDTALGLNDFYTSRSGEETLVSAKRNDGGFVHIVNKLKPDVNARNTFEFDMLINGAIFIEGDEEKNTTDHVVVKGAVFNFRNAMLPVELVVRNPGGMKYFENLDASPSNLIFTKVWGNITNLVMQNEVIEESAFGEAAVKSYDRTIREWLIVGAAKEPYEIGDEKNGITSDDIKKAMADRETYLADVKKRQDEYQASRQTNDNAFTQVTAPIANAAAGGFNF